MPRYRRAQLTPVGVLWGDRPWQQQPEAEAEAELPEGPAPLTEVAPFQMLTEVCETLKSAFNLRIKKKNEVERARRERLRAALELQPGPFAVVPAPETRGVVGPPARLRGVAQRDFAPVRGRLAAPGLTLCAHPSAAPPVVTPAARASRRYMRVAYEHASSAARMGDEAAQELVRQLDAGRLGLRASCGWTPTAAAPTAEPAGHPGGFLLRDMPGFLQKLQNQKLRIFRRARRRPRRRRRPLRRRRVRHRGRRLHRHRPDRGRRRG